MSKIISLYEINTEGYDVNNKSLEVNIKFGAILSVVLAGIFFTSVSLYCICTSQYIIAVCGAGLVYHVYNTIRGWFYPFNLPQLIIDKAGITNKDKFYSWTSITDIKMEITAPKLTLQKEFLVFYLQDGVEVNVLIAERSIDKSIAEVFAYIKHYWNSSDLLV